MPHPVAQFVSSWVVWLSRGLWLVRMNPLGWGWEAVSQARPSGRVLPLRFRGRSREGRGAVPGVRRFELVTWGLVGSTAAWAKAGLKRGGLTSAAGASLSVAHLSLP